jgi:hypothetical protein
LTKARDNTSAVEAAVMQLAFFDVVLFGVIPIFGCGDESFEEVDSFKALIF